MPSAVHVRIHKVHAAVGSEGGAGAHGFPDAAQVFLLASRGPASDPALFMDVTNPIPASQVTATTTPAVLEETLQLQWGDDAQRGGGTQIVAMLDAAGDGVGGDDDDDEELATAIIHDDDVRDIRDDAASYALAPRWIRLKATSARNVDVRVELSVEVVLEKPTTVRQENFAAQRTTTTPSSSSSSAAALPLPDGSNAVRCALPNAASISREDACKAASLADTTLLKRILQTHPDAATATYGTRAETALHAASRHGAAEGARVLLESGAQIEALDADGRTALHIAALAGHDDVAAVLLTAIASANHDAAVRRADLSGFAPIEYAVANGTCADAFRSVCGQAAWDDVVSNLAAL